MEFECYVILPSVKRLHVYRRSLTRKDNPSVMSPKSWAISSKLSRSIPLFSALKAPIPPINGRCRRDMPAQRFAPSVLAVCLLRLKALIRSSFGNFSIDSASATSFAERPVANPVEWDRDRSSESRFPPEAYIMRTCRARTGGARLEYGRWGCILMYLCRCEELTQRIESCQSTHGSKV